MTYSFSGSAGLGLGLRGGGGGGAFLAAVKVEAGGEYGGGAVEGNEEGGGGGDFLAYAEDTDEAEDGLRRGGCRREEVEDAVAVVPDRLRLPPETCLCDCTNLAERESVRNYL